MKNKKIIIIGASLLVFIIIVSVALLTITKKNNKNLTNDSANYATENEIEEKQEKFDVKLNKLVETKASNQEIYELFREYVDVNIKQIDDYRFLIEVKNNTPYDIGKLNIVFIPKKDGKSVYNAYKTVDRTTSFNVISSGETLYAIQSILNAEKNENNEYTTVAVNCDELQIEEFKFSNYYEHSEPYKDILLYNIKYDDTKGALYTINNKGKNKEYPVVQVLYYKGDEVVYVSDNTIYGLDAGKTMDIEHSYNTLTKEYVLPEVEFDRIEATTTRK